MAPRKSPLERQFSFRAIVIASEVHTMATIGSAREDNGARLMTVGQAAAALNLHPDTLRRWGARGIVTTYRVGPRGDRRFHRSEIVHMLKSDEQ